MKEKETEKQTLLCVNDAFVPSESQMMSWCINRGLVEIILEKFTLEKSGGRTE